MSLARSVVKVDAFMPLGSCNPVRQSIYEYSVAGINGDTLHKPGETIILDDGRSFVYASTTTDIAVGEAISTGVSALSVTGVTAGVGATRITCTYSTTVAENALAGGFALFAGNRYMILGNEAKTTSSSGTFNVYLLEPIRVALTNASGSLYPNLYSTVVKSPASTTPAVILGVAQVAVPAATDGKRYYFWAQVGGLGVAKCGVASGTAGVGVSLVQGGEAGVLGAQLAGSSSVASAQVGINLVGLTSTATVIPVLLNIVR